MIEIQTTAEKIGALAETIEELAIDAAGRPGNAGHLVHAIEHLARELKTQVARIEQSELHRQQDGEPLAPLDNGQVSAAH